MTLELRKSPRYELELGVAFRWVGTHGDVLMGAGDTRDISAFGMFVLSRDCPPRDAQLSCEVIVPRSRSAGCLQIKTEGRVIRVEPGPDRSRRGFAVSGNMQVGDQSVSEWLGYSDQAQ
jgi:hypothetical protein